MVGVRIDGKDLTVPAGTTLLKVAQLADIDIPTLCHAEGFKPQTTCMVCVVRVEGIARLLPACSTHVRGGEIIHSNSPEVLAARRANLELLLSEHAGDCEAPCHIACPAGTRIPQMLRAIRDGDLTTAAEIAAADLTLPRTLAHICPAPCTKVCRRGRSDTPVSIPFLHSHLPTGEISPAVPPIGKSVCVAGSGPAGLSAAATLLNAGITCTVIERNQVPGGGLLTATAADATAQETLAEEIKNISSRPNITFRYGEEIKTEQQITTLLTTHDAVILACGATNVSSLARDRVYSAATAQGAKLAVRSIAAGRRIAQSLLRAWDLLPPEEPFFNSRLGSLDDAEMQVFLKETPAVAKKQTHPADTSHLSQEAARCLHCDCRGLDTCRLRKLAAQFGLKSSPQPLPRRRRVQRNETHPAGLVYESGKCILCGLCVALAEHRGDPLAMMHRGFAAQVAPALTDSLNEAIGSAAQDYAALCPTGAMELP